MRIVIRPSLFTNVPTRQEEILPWLRDALLPALQQALETHLHAYPTSLQGELRTHKYTEASKPSAANAGVGAVIISTDAASPPQMSDGTNWIPLSAAIAAATTRWVPTFMFMGA